MPVLRLSDDWPHGPLAFSSLPVFAVMIYPYDREQSNELGGTFLAEWVFREARHWGPPPPEVLWRLLASRHVGRAAQQVLAKAEQARERQGLVSGEQLLLIHDLIHERPASSLQGGVLQSCSMLAEAAKVNHRTILKTPLPHRDARWFYRQVWTRYRSVAHLWLAHMLLSKDNPQSALLPGGYRPGAHILGDHQSFVEFLSLAEHYRQWLTSYRPHALRGQALLQAEETWSCPPEIVLHPFEIIDTAPLAPAYQQARKHYRSPRSRRTR